MTASQHLITFEGGGESLSGQVIEPTGPAAGRLLFVHGAGKATKERVFPLACALAQQGVSCFSFDFSGHGLSSGSLNISSLEKRERETESAIRASGFKHPFALCGFSMGAHVVLRMLKQHNPEALILFYPAIYTDEARSIPFGNPTFTETIRRERSWAASSVLADLDAFTGRLLIVIGDRDEVIPKDVITLLDMHSASATRKQIVVVRGGTHQLLPYIYADQAQFELLCTTIVSFIAEN